MKRTEDEYYIESAYFAYYSRELGCKTFLCMRKLEDGNIFKPYAIIDEHTFKAGITELRKGKNSVLTSRLPIQTGLLS